MASTEEHDGAVDLTAPGDAPVLDGDDITVEPASSASHGRRHMALVAAAIIGAIALVGALVAFVGDDDETTTVRDAEDATTQTTVALAEAAVKAPAPKPGAKNAKTSPTTDAPVAGATIAAETDEAGPGPAPGSVAPQVFPVVPPPTQAPTPPAPPAPPKVYPASKLFWTMPAPVTMKTGKQALLAVSVYNPTDGTISLPIPLSYAPRLQGDGMCPQVAQEIGPGQTANTTWKVDADGVTPGSYTLNFAGLVTLKVTVTA